MNSTSTPDRLPPIPGASDDPNLPRLVNFGGVYAPAAPVKLDETGIDSGALIDLVLKHAYTVPHFTTEWMVERLHLSLPLVRELLEELRQQRMFDVLGQSGVFGYRYSIAQRGRERAPRALEISGHVGPAPVSLAAYTALLQWQLARCPRARPEEVTTAVGDLVLPDHVLHVGGMAITSGRSLFVFGPPGNGKTSLGRLLHRALQGELWVPYCIGIETSVIRVYDDHWHEPAPPLDQGRTADQRWVRIRRPFLSVGGEATLDSFELTHSPVHRFYEAPAHFKANGGTFLIDDFGRERMDPNALLNRWITPLEHQFDYMTLQTGQKIQVPFQVMLILATNLDPNKVMDPAFLRRMGYRLYLGNPTPEQYARIFERYAQRCAVSVPPGLIDRLLERYRAERRPFRSCEPRDLVERARDYCGFCNRPLELNEETLDRAWVGYFGNKQAMDEHTEAEEQQAEGARRM
jgi:hypothetical protein